MINLVSFIPRAVVQGIPLLFGSTGEIMTEKSGNLNLGIPGVMYVGAISGVMGSFFYEQSVSDRVKYECFSGNPDSHCVLPCWLPSVWDFSIASLLLPCGPIRT